MKLVLTSLIRASEFEPFKSVFNLEIIGTAARKAIEGLGDSIKSSAKISGTQLKKLYLTSTGGAGRVIFLLKVGKQKAVLVMLRPKNDKQIGVNMTVRNPRFRKVLEKNLDMILADLQLGHYEEFDL